MICFAYYGYVVFPNTSLRYTSLSVVSAFVFLNSRHNEEFCFFFFFLNHGVTSTVCCCVCVSGLRGSAASISSTALQKSSHLAEEKQGKIVIIKNMEMIKTTSQLIYLSMFMVLTGKHRELR